MGSENWGAWVTEETIMTLFVAFVVIWFCAVFVFPLVEHWFEQKKGARKR